MASSSSYDAGAPSSRHLDVLFATAQVVTGRPELAAELVKRTYRLARERGFTPATQPEDIERERVELLRLLLEESGVTAGSTGEAAGGAGGMDESPGRRRRLAERIVDRMAPAAFATLSREHRILLTLCDVQGMASEDAAAVLGLDSREASARLEAGRRTLRRKIFESATSHERRILTESLGPSAMTEALRRLADAELTAVPPTLEATVAAGPGMDTDWGAGAGWTAAADPAAAADPMATSGDHPAVAPADQQRGPLFLHRLARGGRRAEPRGWPRILTRAVAVLLIIAVAGLLGYGFSTMTSRAPEANLIALSAGDADALETTFATASPEQAERYVLDRLGWRVRVPTIQEAELQGISIRDVSDGEGAEAPIILYRNSDAENTIAVYVYSYAFLDQHRDRLHLSRDVLDQIEEEGHFDLHDLGDEKALIWRQRDDIYIAITRGDAEALRERIGYES